MRSSSSSESATLLVGYEGESDELEGAITALGGEITGRIGSTSLRVTLPQSKIDTLCGIESVTAVELDSDEVRTLDAGGFRPQTDSMM